MLYVFTGSDTGTAKKEARGRAAKVGAEVVLFGEGALPFDDAMNYVGASGLFAPKVVLLIDRMLESAGGKALIEAHGEALAESDTEIYLIEPELGATEKKLLPKKTKVEEFNPSTGSGQIEERPNVFAFTDAFMAGAKKRSWIGYRRLIESGIAAEEIHGAMMWAVRSALIAAKTKSAIESGLKPFVYTKSKAAALKLGVPKVENLSRSLVAAYHRARAGGGDLGMLTEALILDST